MDQELCGSLFGTKKLTLLLLQGLGSRNRSSPPRTCKEASKHTQAYLLARPLASPFACFFEDKFSVYSCSNLLQHNIWYEKSQKHPVMGEDFFSVFLGSQCVLTRLPSSSQWVPILFPNMFFIAPHFYPICFGKCCPLFTYIDAPKGIISVLQNRTI